MKAPRNKTKRATKRGERHGYATEGSMRKELALAKKHIEELEDENESIREENDAMSEMLNEIKMIIDV
jgi:hypothetical protein